MYDEQLAGLGKDSDLKSFEDAGLALARVVGCKEVDVAKAKMLIEEELRGKDIAASRRRFVLKVLSEKCRKRRKRLSRQGIDGSSKTRGWPMENTYPTPERVMNVPRDPIQIRELLGKYLLVKDIDLIDIVLAVLASHTHPLPGNWSPIWLMLIAPSSSGKTEYVTLADALPHSYAISTVTPKTFFSGLDIKDSQTGEEPSLMMRLRNHILTFKDMTSLLSLHANDRSVIFGDLREIYDGKYDKDLGNGKSLHWSGKITILAGVTPVIEKFGKWNDQMGPRFLFYRPTMPNRQEVLEFSFEHVGSQDEDRKLVQQAIASYIQALPTDLDPQLTLEQKHTIAALADIAALLRTPVEPDKYPDPEFPTRVAKSLWGLARNLSIIYKSKDITPEAMRKMAKVAWDTVPRDRSYVIRYLAKATEGVASLAIAKDAPFSAASIERALNDLQRLEAVEDLSPNPTVVHRWALRPHVRELLERVPKAYI